MGFSKIENVSHCMPDFSPWAEKGNVELLLETDQIFYLQKYWQSTFSREDGESVVNGMISLMAAVGRQAKLACVCNACACLAAFCVHMPPLGLLRHTGACKCQGVCVRLYCVCARVYGQKDFMWEEWPASW